MQKDTSRIQVVSICGNIGAGKATLMRRLERDVRDLPVRSKILFEPVEIWGPLIEQFGHDRLSAAYNLQMMVIRHYQEVTRQLEDWEKELESTADYGVVLIERSIIDSMMVFIPVNREAMTVVQYTECHTAASRLLRHRFWTHLICIRLDVSLAECGRRINVRDRSGERCLPPQYLKNLEEYYQKLEVDYTLKNENEEALNANCIFILERLRSRYGQRGRTETLQT